MFWCLRLEARRRPRNFRGQKARIPVAGTSRRSAGHAHIHSFARLGDNLSTLSSALLITGCAELVTLRGPAPRRSRAMRELGIVRDGALLIVDGRIAAVGRRKDISRHSLARHAKKLDLGGRVVLPGFVDSHTHLIFACSRAAEYERRIAGATYEEIARSGGGILSSVQNLRRAAPTSLEARARQDLRRFAEHGTTTLEAKSGYGLDAESELKTLRLYSALNSTQPVEIASTFLGAHVVPPEYRRRKHGTDAYVRFLTDELTPQVAREGLAEFCDVFCDRGAFTVAQSRAILKAGRACGLIPRIHAEQLSRTGGAAMAVALCAASADHLEHVNSSDIKALAASATVATLLPGCGVHCAHSHHAPARKLIDAGAIVAIATDYNPGTSPTLSMSMILSLACAHLRMTPAEAIAAATINAAYSLRRADRIGSLEVGKFADLAAFDVADYREIPYYFGVNLCVMTMKRGKLIFTHPCAKLN
jgi:imidazolonepropionase